VKYEYEDEVKTKGLSLKVWKRLLPYAATMKKQFILALFIVVLWTSLNSAFPLFTSYAVNNFIIPGTTQGLIPFSIIYFGIILLVGFLTYAWVKLLIWIDVKIALMIRRACFIHLQKIQIAYHNTTSVGYLIGRVMSDTERISGMLSWGFTAIAEASLVIFFSVAYMLILSPPLALILICIIPVAWVIAWVFQRKILVVSRKVREINSRITGAYNEGITGSKTSKTLVIEDLNSAEFAKLSDNMQRQSVRQSRLTAIMLPMVASVGSIARSIGLY